MVLHKITIGESSLVRCQVSENILIIRCLSSASFAVAE